MEKENLTTINEGRERLKFSNVASLHSKLFTIIIKINIRFIDGLDKCQSSWNASSVISVLCILQKKSNLCEGNCYSQSICKVNTYFI